MGDCNQVTPRCLNRIGAHVPSSAESREEFVLLEITSAKTIKPSFVQATLALLISACRVYRVDVFLRWQRNGHQHAFALKQGCRAGVVGLRWSAQWR